MSLETILDEVRQNCPTDVLEGIGKFLGAGYYGETYEVDGGDKVMKVSVAKTEADANKTLDKVREIDALGSDAFVKVFDYGVLCEIDIPDSKYMIKSGVAYFYVMERLFPLSADEKKVATRTLNDLESLANKPDFERERKKYMFSKGRQYKRDGDDESALVAAADLFDRMRAVGAGHRDMHKENVMKNAEGRFKMIDLEQAKLLGSSPAAA